MSTLKLDQQQYTFLLAHFSLVVPGLIFNACFLTILLSRLKEIFRSSNLILCLNLSLADSFLFLHVFLTEVRMLIDRSPIHNTIEGILDGSFIYGLGFYVLLSLMLVSIERYNIILHSRQTPPRQLALFICICFIISVLAPTAPIFFIPDPYVLSKAGFFYSVNFGTSTPAQTLVSLFVLLMLVIPLHVIFFSYWKIIKKVRNELFKPFTQFSFSSSRSEVKESEKSTVEVDKVRSASSSFNTPEPTSTHGRRSVTVSSLASRSSVARQNKDLELQIVRKSLAIVSAHIFLWSPYCTFCVLCLFGFSNLPMLEFFGAFGIGLSSNVNASFSIAMDPKIQRFARDFFAHVLCRKVRT